MLSDLARHDRSCLDRVVTSTIVAESDDENPGKWRECEGGVQDWLIQSARAKEIAAKAAATAPDTRNYNEKGLKATTDKRSQLSKKKLSFKEQRELEAIPATMAALEAEQADIRQQLNDPGLYTRDPQAAATLHARDAAIDDELLAALERQEVLAV